MVVVVATAEAGVVVVVVAVVVAVVVVSVAVLVAAAVTRRRNSITAPPPFRFWPTSTAPEQTYIVMCKPVGGGRRGRDPVTREKTQAGHTATTTPQVFCHL